MLDTEVYIFYVLAVFSFLWGLFKMGAYLRGKRPRRLYSFYGKPLTGKSTWQYWRPFVCPFLFALAFAILAAWAQD